MRKNSKLFAGCLSAALALVVSQANAALPPLYESLNEYKTLLASPQLTTKLDSADLIQDIQRDSYGFLIKTSKHTMKVDVEYEPQKLMGPAKYHFVFHDPEPVAEQRK